MSKVFASSCRYPEQGKWKKDHELVVTSTTSLLVKF
uniref:Uncharacterized protein n=1 Tax=Rhizophora mucronata TaxID=61149 RepID=A0A2P2QCF3_RHIMU